MNSTVTGRRLTAATISLTGASLGLALLAGSAAAAAPANRACLGHDVSTYALGPGAHGAVVSGLAHAHGGMGQLTQQHLAGAIPDSFVENSCND